MYRFLVWHALIVSISCELFKEESGYVVDYAPQYHNYKPKDYHFNYAVSDPHTGDHKSQWETKTDGVVRGGYSLLEPDGTTRIVEYVADDDGFRAVVNKVGNAIHPQEVPHAVGPIVPLSHKSYDGQITNYAPSAQYYVDQTLGTVAPVNQIHTVGTTGVVPESHSEIILQQQAIPVTQNHATGIIQGQSLGVVPQLEQNIGGTERLPQFQGHNLRVDSAHNILEQNLDRSAVPHVEGHNLKRPEVVPLIQGYDIIQRKSAENIDDNLGRIVLQGYNIPRDEVIPFIHGQERQIYGNVGYDFGQGHNIVRPEAVSLSQGHIADNIQAVPNQEGHIISNIGYNLDQGHNMARAEPVPLSQGHNFGNIQAVPSQDRQILGNVGYDVGQGHNVAKSEAVLLSQGHNLGNIQAVANQEGQISGNVRYDLGQGHNIARSEVVPLSQGHNLGNIQGLPHQEDRIFGTVGYGLGQEHNTARSVVVPLSQGHNLANIQALSNQESQIFGNVGHDLDRVEVQGHNIVRAEVVPLSQEHNLGSFEAVPRLTNENLHNFDPNLRQLEYQGHNIARAGVVPEIQKQTLGPIELQGYNIEGSRVESVPQGQYSAEGEATVPFQGHLVAPHSQGHNEGQILVDRNYLVRSQIPVSQGQIPEGPSYSTVVDFQGENFANRLRKDVHHSSASRKVIKVVPAPHNKDKHPKKDFLIYYPESQ